MARRIAKKADKATKKRAKKKPIDSYDHKDKKRANNPPVGLVTPQTDPVAGRKKTYQYAPPLDPQLVWAGKAEHTSFSVPAVSLHVHERIDPRTIIEAVRRNGESGQWLVVSGQKKAVHSPLTTSHFKQLPLFEHSPLTTRHSADASVGRSGETLRQDEWRDELLKCGIRGKSGQHIHFSRVETLSGARWLHADAEEVVDSGQGIVNSGKKGAAAKLSTNHSSLSTTRIVVSFGPEHAPLEQRQVEQALEETQLLKPKPKMVVFASFQFDPEAAKDIDETNWPGITLLKVQMNTDLLTDDLKKKRSSNESFWMIGQPDVVVNSEQWLVNSRREALAPYDVVAELSGTHRLAEINGLGRDDLSLLLAIAQRRDLWAAVATDAGRSVGPGKHRGGTGKTRNGGVSTLSWYRSRIPGRIGDAGDFVRQLAALSARDRTKRIKRLRGSREIADRAGQIAATIIVDSGQGIVNSKGKTGIPDHAPLSTIHYLQATIQGFDYYNPIDGKIESGDTSMIAMWMLDTDYDGRSLYPRQVFFPMAGAKDGWARLARSLKAEIDEELIEAYRGTVSLPFEPGDHQRVAVKIIDDRGIESLKIVEVG